MTRWANCVFSSANSGSLPDLTNLNFPPPLSTPLDVPESAHDKASVSHHSRRHNHVEPLVFSTATNNHLLAGGSVVSNNQVSCILPTWSLHFSSLLLKTIARLSAEKNNVCKLITLVCMVRCLTRNSRLCPIKIALC